MKTLRTIALWVVCAAMAPAVLRADDKAILQAAGGHAQVIILLDNSIASSGNINDQNFKTSTNLGKDTFGGADTADAKMKIAKDVLLDFLSPGVPTNTEWAIATFERGNGNWAPMSAKEFIYEQGPNPNGCDFPCAAAYAQKDGVWERWGPGTPRSNKDPNFGFSWPTDPDPRGASFTPPRSFCTNFNFSQYPTGGETSIIPLNASDQGFSSCAAAGTTYTRRIKMTWQTGNHYYLLSCQPGNAGGPCLTLGSNTVVIVRKDHETCSAGCNNNSNWHSDANVMTTYTYVQSFIATGAHGIDDRSTNSPTNSCSTWETGPNSPPSVKFPPPTDTGCLALLRLQMETVADSVDVTTTGGIISAKSFDCSGNVFTQDTNSVIAPIKAECVNNSLNQKGAAGYFESLCADACANRYVIFITDDLQANQQTDPCASSQGSATSDLSVTSQRAGGCSLNPGVQVLTIYLGSQAAANDATDQAWWKCLPPNTAIPTGKPIAPPGYFAVSDANDLLSTLHAIASLIDQNTKDFASATVSSVQTGTDQIALLATFNATNTRSIWNGHLKAYELNSNGLIDTSHSGQVNIKDPITGGTTLLKGVPSNDPQFLMWNAGANLEALDDSSSSGVMATLSGDATLSTATYADDSNDVLTHPPTYSWPGRKIIFGVEQTTAGTVPETRVDFQSVKSAGTPPYPPDPASCASYATCPWYWLKYYYFTLSPSDETGSNTKADNAIHFIRGDRNAVVTALGLDPGLCLFGRNTTTGACLPPDTAGPNGSSESAFLYNDFAYDPNGVNRVAFNGEERLGDIFHSNPTIMGRPNNVTYFNLDLNPDGATGHDYASFYKRLRRRRQVLFAGANDGLLHAFDVGAFRRGQNLTTCPNGTDAITGNNLPGNTANPFGGCYDLGLGSEIFAYAPRAIMSSFDSLTRDLAYIGFPQEWTADGLTTADDMFISNNSSNAAVRNWRSILIGSLREGSRNFTNAGVSGFRGSYFALDVTQPDSLPAFDPANPDPNSPTPYTGLSTTDSHHSPKCISAAPGDPAQGTSTAGCAAGSNGNAVEYPRVLWEFNDTATNGVPSDGTDGLAVNLPADADGSSDPGKGYPDLGETWSKPALGRIELPLNSSNPNNQHTCISDNSKNCEDKYVAIFGGGFDSEKKNRRGNWIYVVDVETGSVLFKTNSGIDSTGTTIPFGAMPAQPLVVDYTFDGYLDVVYIGDLNGRMWRMFINCNPSTINFNATSSPLRTSNKITTTGSVKTRPWQPFLFFNDPRAAALILPSTSNVCGGVTPAYNYCNALSTTCATKPCTTVQGPPRSIYYGASPVYISAASNGLPKLGISFSTGERDDIRGTAVGLNSAPGSNYQTYRFYYVIDDPTSAATTYTEANLTAISPTVNNDGSLSFSGSCTVSGSGWYINMPGNGFTDTSGAAMVGERGISEIVAVGGYIYFATFMPNKPGNVTIPDPNDPTHNITLCSQSGIARVYRIYYNYCNGGTVDAAATKVGEFASNPVAYVDSTGVIHVIDATEASQIYNDTKVQAVSSRIKNWKEQ